ncbi:MAG: nucleoside deaminase [Candidatus Izemoplasmatales bacterium]
MTWEELEFGWQMAFNKAWNAFCSNTIPIGAVILNENNELVSLGQNMIFVEQTEAPVIYGSSLAHAEINAIVQLKRKEHPNIRSYTLYSTTEPCILCFGAIVMGNIRHFKFAARDRYAGAVKYNEHSGYVKSKNIIVEGPHAELEAVQLALATYYELDKNLPNHEHIISQMALDCPEGVSAGRELFNKSILRQIAEENGSEVDAFREICNQLKMTSD